MQRNILHSLSACMARLCKLSAEANNYTRAVAVAKLALHMSQHMYVIFKHTCEIRRKINFSYFEKNIVDLLKHKKFIHGRIVHPSSFDA
jgi:hypothetical protein